MTIEGIATLLTAVGGVIAVLTPFLKELRMWRKSAAPANHHESGEADSH